MTDRHKVFISFHDDDFHYKERFETMMEGYIVDKSVHDGDIDDQRLVTSEIRRRIRDSFIADATVTVVLVGPCTWRRKHVDWEIGSSLRNTKKNSRCGLLGILLPNHPNYNTKKLNQHLVPPRLSDNCSEGGYASMHKWSNSPRLVQKWIDKAFDRRGDCNPNNRRKQFGKNSGIPCSQGWQ